LLICLCRDDNYLVGTSVLESPSGRLAIRGLPFLSNSLSSCIARSSERKDTIKLEPMAHSMLISLPVELLHNVLFDLDTASVLSARLTCRVLSVLGLDHSGDEIPLIFHRDKFRALKEIAAHVVLAKRMRSLYYAGGIVSWQGWHE
jgi:hypothetical protein